MSNTPTPGWDACPLVFIAPPPRAACPNCNHDGAAIIVRTMPREADGSITRRCVCRACSNRFLVVVDPDLASDWQIESPVFINCNERR